jgi:hypothetical protein
MASVTSSYPSGSHTNIILSKILLWKCSMWRSPTTVDLHGACPIAVTTTASCVASEKTRRLFITFVA